MQAKWIKLDLLLYADPTMKNKDGKTAFELSRNADCGALLQRASKSTIPYMHFSISLCGRLDTIDFGIILLLGL
mgnify:CR=1 FL=1